MNSKPAIRYEKCDYSQVEKPGDSHFDPRAYDIVLEAVCQAGHEADAENREFTCDDICRNLCSLAIDVYGPMASSVFIYMGISQYSIARDIMKRLYAAKILLRMPSGADGYFWDETSLMSDLDAPFRFDDDTAEESGNDF